MRKFYQLAVNQETREADVTIFGDITSWEWLESDVSSYTLSKELGGLDVDVINVHINSYGGEVAEGLAIYNVLKQHKAKVKTYCDGFACSAASVVFMAGDERIMSAASLLMIHNAWTYTQGNASELRKAADDLDTITGASVAAYMACVNIDKDRVVELMDAESWIAPPDALEMGFATSVVGDGAKSPSQSARKIVFDRLTSQVSPAPKAPPAQPKPKEKNLSTFLNALCAKKGDQHEKS